ncbi:MAG: hypothetical protein JO168_09380 [Solirubrobacterales bacterium]|nr:hypothetical protein [Solirubrobacterales bacterium]
MRQRDDLLQKRRRADLEGDGVRRFEQHRDLRRTRARKGERLRGAQFRIGGRVGRADRPEALGRGAPGPGVALRPRASSAVAKAWKATDSGGAPSPGTWLIVSPSASTAAIAARLLARTV